MRPHIWISALGLSLMATTGGCKRHATDALAGSSPDNSIHVDGMVERDAWIKERTCAGAPMTGYEICGVNDKPSEYMHVIVECPAGKKHDVYFVLPPHEERQRAEAAEPIVQNPKTPFVDALLPKMVGRWGVHSSAELKRKLLVPKSEWVRNTAWLLDWVRDSPTELEVWHKVLAENPNDLEATMGIIGDLTETQRWDEEIAFAEQVDISKLSLADTRGQTMFRATSVLSNECYALWQKGLMDRAIAKCKESIDKGSQVGAEINLSYIYISDGRFDQAIELLKRAATHKGDASIYFLLGVAFSAENKNQEARSAWQEAIAKTPQYMVAAEALNGVKRTPQQWLAADGKLHTRETSTLAAACWHYYTELDVPERAAQCKALSQRLDPVPVQAEELRHLAESSPSTALEKLLPLARSTHDPLVLRELAAVHHLQGRDAEAMRWLDFAIDGLPGDERSEDLLAEIAGQTPIQEYLDAYRAKAGANRPPPWQ